MKLLATSASLALIAAPAFAQHHDHQNTPAPTVDQPASGAAPVDHSMHSNTPVADQAQPVEDHSMHGAGAASEQSGSSHGMTSAFAPYPMQRDASGTAWQPDTAQHDGIMVHSGDWMLMGHAELDLVYDWQGGPRGDTKAFAAGMLMGMASRPIGNGSLQFKAMLSPDPLMGKRGYPLLLASGETADGVEHLVDRQHPHDFFMELSASVSQRIDDNTSVFLYGGLPGEPAFGPPAFQHRQSINASPEAPISHHWLDSTHITFGVLTAGVIVGDAKLEVSRFNGREPDQYRWNIETGPLDSTSARVSFNPTRTLSLQGSWAKLREPEQLEPGVDQKRWSASATWTVPLSSDGWVSTSALWGRKKVEGHADDALALESSLGWKQWTLFGRAEQTENRELVEPEGDDDHGPAYKVAKASIGVIRDFPVAKNFKVGVGGLYAFNFVPGALKAAYGGNPNGAMAFIRLKVD